MAKPRLMTLTMTNPMTHALQVMAFWGKAQRVVLYKIKTEVDAKKKEVMDKQVRPICHLSFRIDLDGGGRQE